MPRIGISWIFPTRVEASYVWREKTAAAYWKGMAMRRTGLLLIIGVMVAVLALCVGAAAPKSAPESTEIEQLKKEVAALRQRVELLEERLKNELVPTSITDKPGVINPYPGPRQTPPNWKSFEFNGMSCYICPIEETHKHTSEAKKQAPCDPAPAASKAADNR